jgi:glucosyl-dolichyl phosphate glucuronosyltransferase
MNQAPFLSIIICSHNRSHDVLECLAALVPQTGNDSEIILVDSACDPEHKRAMEAMATTCPALKLIRVEQAGLSLARNRGAQVARADWLVFLDDDAVPFPDWYQKCRAVFSTAPPTQVVIGGAIIPRWPAGSSGEHLSKRWKMFLSLAETTTPGSLRRGYEIKGANYAIRRAVLLEIGGFSEDLGRVGQSLISGEESQVAKAVLERGLEAGFNPDFKVYHKISAERLKLPWILKRTYFEGVSDIRIFHSGEQPLPPRLHPLKLFLSLPALTLLSLILFRNHDYKIRAAMCLGACSSLLKRWLTPKESTGRAK